MTSLNKESWNGMHPRLANSLGEFPIRSPIQETQAVTDAGFKPRVEPALGAKQLEVLARTPFPNQYVKTVLKIGS